MARKVGEHLQVLPYRGILVGARAGKLGVMIPTALRELVGLRKGQRLKVKVASGKVTLTFPRMASSQTKTPPLRRSGAERIRFESQWNRLVRRLNRARRGRAP